MNSVSHVFKIMVLLSRGMIGQAFLTATNECCCSIYHVRVKERLTMLGQCSCSTISSVIGYVLVCLSLIYSTGTILSSPRRVVRLREVSCLIHNLLLSGLISRTPRVIGFWHVNETSLDVKNKTLRHKKHRVVGTFVSSSVQLLLATHSVNIAIFRIKMDFIYFWHEQISPFRPSCLMSKTNKIHFYLEFCIFWSHSCVLV